MNIEITTSGHIHVNDQDTGLAVTQTGNGTIVFKREKLDGSQKYEEIRMPHNRYSLAHDAPRPLHKTAELAAKYPAPAGRAQFESDIRAILGL